MTRRYTAWLEGLDGTYETTIEAADLESAWDAAEEWALDFDGDDYDGDGDYGDYVSRSAYGHLIVADDESGEERSGMVLVAEAEDDDGCDGPHEWTRPHDVVGGLRENPGVWSRGGLHLEFRSVCARCGVLRIETIDEQAVPPLHEIRYFSRDAIGGAR